MGKLIPITPDMFNAAIAEMIQLIGEIAATEAAIVNAEEVEAFTHRAWTEAREAVIALRDEALRLKNHHATLTRVAG